MTARRENLLAAEIAGRLAGCPTGEELQLFHEGSMGQGARRAISDHAEHCPSCVSALAFLEQAVDASSAPAVELPNDLERRSELLIELATELGPPRVFSRRPLLLGGTVAALAIAALMLGWFWLAPTALPIRGVPERIERLRPIEPRGVVDRPPSRFSWTPDPRASRYRVLLGRDGVADRSLGETLDTVPTLEPDPETVAALSRGVEYSWSVATLGPTGEEIERSAAAHFSVAARSP